MGRVRASARRVRLLVAAWLTAYLPRLTQRRPVVAIDVGPWLPGWVLRLVLGGLTVACASVVARGPLTWALLIIFVGAVVIWPSGVGPAAVVIVVAILAASAPESLSPSQTALLVLGLHAMAQLGPLLGGVAWRAKIEIAVLAAPLPRFVATQALVQPLALLGGWLAGRVPLDGVGAAALPVVALLGLAAVTYFWFPHLGDR